MITVEEIKDLEPLRALEPEWNRLVEHDAGAEVYRTFGWLSAWWCEHGGRGRELAVLSVRDGSTLIAVAPLMRVRRSLMRLPVRSVEFVSMWKYAGSPASCLGSMDIACGNCREEALGAILSYLEQRAGTWDVIRFHPISEDSPTLPSLEKEAGRRHFGFKKRTVFSSAVIRAEGGPALFSSGLSHKFQERLTQADKRLRQRGAVSFTLCDSPADAPRAFDEMMAIERHSWKWKKGIALNSTVFRNFYCILARETAQRGWLRLWFLCVNGKSIAFAYLVKIAGNVDLLKIGYDEEYAACSPGSLVLRHAFDELFRSGAKRINMLYGDMEYKERWLARPEPYCEVFLFRNGAYPAFLQFLHFRLSLYGRFWFIDIFVKRVARKLGIRLLYSELTRMDQLRRNSRRR